MNEALAQEVAPFGIKGTGRIPASMTIVNAVAALNWESREKGGNAEKGMEVQGTGLPIV